MNSDMLNVWTKKRPGHGTAVRCAALMHCMLTTQRRSASTPQAPRIQGGVPARRSASCCFSSAMVM